MTIYDKVKKRIRELQNRVAKGKVPEVKVAARIARLEAKPPEWWAKGRSLRDISPRLTLHSHPAAGRIPAHLKEIYGQGIVHCLYSCRVRPHDRLFRRPPLLTDGYRFDAVLHRENGQALRVSRSHQDGKVTSRAPRSIVSPGALDFGSPAARMDVHGRAPMASQQVNDPSRARQGDTASELPTTKAPIKWQLVQQVPTVGMNSGIALHRLELQPAGGSIPFHLGPAGCLSAAGRNNRPGYHRRSIPFVQETP